MVEGDVIPVNTTSVHSTPVAEPEPSPAPEPKTHHQLVSNNFGKSNNLTTNYQPISTANNIPQAPVSEPVGYFNVPPVAPPPQRVMSPMEERMELVRHILLNKITENHIRIPNLLREINNWWYNAITNVMVYVDGFKFINPVNNLYLKNDENGSTVTTRINGELPTGEKHEHPIPVGYRFDINDSCAMMEFSINQKAFVIIDIDFNNMIYEIARFPETLRHLGLSEKYIDHVIAPLMLETFHEKKR
jgi:hypothetical protein